MSVLSTVCESNAFPTEDEGPHYWNYRVIGDSAPTGGGDFEDVLTIHEVYYDSNDAPHSWSADPMWPQGESLDGLRAELNRMLEALDKPIINKEDLPGV